MKSIIHINKHHIAANLKHGTKLPVITVKQGGRNIKCDEVEILGPSKVVHSPDKPLSCGARVWIETEAELKIKPRQLTLTAIEYSEPHSGLFDLYYKGRLLKEALRGSEAFRYARDKGYTRVKYETLYQGTQIKEVD
jgi:hypothetical protein